MIEITSGTAENVIVAEAHGTVTGADYEDVLVPAIEAALQTHRKVRVLYHLGEDFSGFTAGAMWDDAKLGLGHRADFEAFAVVTDVRWVVDAVKFFGVFLRYPVKIFGNAQMSEARNWIAAVHA